MADRLAPLNALRTFEVAARHLSLTKAAEELHVTPAAVSQQIKALEAALGVVLFQRLPRGLALTAAARAGLPQLREGFNHLIEASQRMRNQGARETLTLRTAPSFAAKWLVPRLHRFAAAHPEIDMRLAASDQLIANDLVRSGLSAEQFQRLGIDMAITFSRGQHPGCEAHKLLTATAVPLCSPTLLKGKHPLRTPDDLRHHTLLHDDTDYADRPGWTDWLAEAGMSGVDAERGLHFNQVALALEAAIDGQGVVLSLEPLAAADIAAGRLVIPFGPSLELAQAYYLVYPQGNAEQPSVVALRDWVLQQASKAGSGSTVASES